MAWKHMIIIVFFELSLLVLRFYDETFCHLALNPAIDNNEKRYECSPHLETYILKCMKLKGR